MSKKEYIVVEKQNIQNHYDEIKKRLKEGFWAEDEKSYYKGQLDILDSILRNLY